MKTTSLFFASLICGCLLFTLAANAAYNQELSISAECTSIETSEDDNSCNVELESIKCYSGDSYECYTAIYYFNRRKESTYQINVETVQGSTGTRYWISYTDKSLGQSYQLLKYFDTPKKAISNWVKKVIGDCPYSFR